MPADPAGVLILGGGLCAAVVASRLADARVPFRIICPTDEPRVSTGLRQSPTGQHRHRGLALAWRDGLGGTTTAWGGQLWPWQPDDHGPDWPTWTSSLEPHYRYVGELLDPGHGRFHASANTRSSSLWPELSTMFDLRSSTWLPWRRRSVTPLLRRLLARDRGSLVEGRAIRIAPGSSGVAVTVETPRGLDEVTGGVVVVAAGTLGTLRLLAESRQGAAQWSSLGLGVVDHVSLLVGSVRANRSPQQLLSFGERFEAGRRRTPKLVFADGRSGRRAYAHFRPAAPQRMPLTAGMESAVASLRAAIEDHRRPAPFGYEIRVDVEQLVEDGHRFALGDGPPKLRWDVTQDERDFASRIGTTVMDRIRDGLPDVTIEEGGPGVGADIYHLMGGFSLESGPRATVTSDLRLAGMPQVAVVGLGTFPEAGVANPSYLAAAMASKVGVDIATGGG